MAEPSDLQPAAPESDPPPAVVPQKEHDDDDDDDAAADDSDADKEIELGDEDSEEEEDEEDDDEYDEEDDDEEGDGGVVPAGPGLSALYTEEFKVGDSHLAVVKRPDPYAPHPVIISTHPHLDGVEETLDPPPPPPRRRAAAAASVVGRSSSCVLCAVWVRRSHTEPPRAGGKDQRGFYLTATVLI